jgi:hypothetical protein
MFGFVSEVSPSPFARSNWSAVIALHTAWQNTMALNAAVQRSKVD